jgi:transposase
MKVKTVGIDLARETFGLNGLDGRGRGVVHKRVTRKHLLRFLVKLERCVLGMEACSWAYYWGAKLKQLGHPVRLMSPRY